MAAGSNTKFEKMDVKRVYFGNWLRDYCTPLWRSAESQRTNVLLYSPGNRRWRIETAPGRDHPHLALGAGILDVWLCNWRIRGHSRETWMLSTRGAYRQPQGQRSLPSTGIESCANIRAGLR